MHCFLFKLCWSFSILWLRSSINLIGTLANSSSGMLTKCKTFVGWEIFYKGLRLLTGRLGDFWSGILLAERTSRRERRPRWGAGESGDWSKQQKGVLEPNRRELSRWTDRRWLDSSQTVCHSPVLARSLDIPRRGHWDQERASSVRLCSLPLFWLNSFNQFSVMILPNKLNWCCIMLSSGLSFNGILLRPIQQFWQTEAFNFG